MQRGEKMCKPAIFRALAIAAAVLATGAASTAMGKTSADETPELDSDCPISLLYEGKEYPPGVENQITRPVEVARCFNRELGCWIVTMESTHVNGHVYRWHVLDCPSGTPNPIY